jgi:DnaK suppressor protein
MSNTLGNLDTAFIERQRQQLMKLRKELLKSSNAAETEEGGIKSGSILEAREYEDDAQKLDMLEKEGNLVSRSVDRLGRVERALRKIDEGTYGISDVSGQRIPENRLVAEPEAINTVAEQEASERSAR